MSGAILETWVISEILKGWWHSGKRPALYFYRDRDKKEQEAWNLSTAQPHDPVST